MLDSVYHMTLKLGQIPVFRVIRPYLNLLEKRRKFFRFSRKKIIFYAV